MSSTRVEGPAQLLRRAPSERIDAEPHLWGFGGVHGGLTLAMLTRAMSAEAPPDARLRTASARMHRPIDGPFAVSTELVRAGRTTTVSARAAVDTDVRAHATASFATVQGAAPSSHPAFAAGPPRAPAPERCERFAVPPEFVPISAFMEVRPVGPNRPYAGGDEPALTAWIRLIEDNDPLDAYRLLVLLDALAPSYAAVLGALQMIPTFELGARIVDPPRSTSPWTLLHARTVWATADGWLEEHIDAWDLGGVHIASAHQLRRVV